MHYPQARHVPEASVRRRRGHHLRLELYCMTALQPYCTCGNESGWARLWDQIWVHPDCGKPSRLFWLGEMGFEDMTIWAVPPRGVTKSTVRIGPDIRHHYTYFCDTNEECFAVAYAMTEEGARRELQGHVCPAPVRRDMMPSGKTAVQKMWDELDEIIDLIKDHDPTNEEASNRELAEHRQGYAMGLAMALAFTAIPYFRSQEDILRHANKRWRIRTGQIPWEATPGYNFYPAAPLAYVEKTERTSPKRTPLKSTAKAPKVEKVATPAVREFAVAERQMIIKGVHENGISLADLASMFGVSEERIKTIAGPKPGTGPAVVTLDLFG